MNFRYPGTKPFTANDSATFLGREQEIEALYKSVWLNQLTMLFGKSGIGKSSLLNAGLIPMIEQKAQYLTIWVRFGNYNKENTQTPLQILRQTLLQYATKTTFIDAIWTETPSIWQIFKNILLDYSHKYGILLLFDQFEELFTYPTEQVNEFAKEYAELINNRMPIAFKEKMMSQLENLTEDELEYLDEPSPHKIVMSIRTDRLALVNRLTDYVPFILQNCFELKPLSLQSAENALIIPAQKKGDYISPTFTYPLSTVDTIFHYLTQGYTKEIETFQLQVICQFIEEKIIQKATNQVTTENTTTLSIEVQDLGNIADIYQNFYQYFLDKQPVTEREAIAKLIEEGLIFEEEQQRIPLYEGQILKQYDLSAETLRRLIDSHLIRAEASQKGYFYEISHDTLVAPILRIKQMRAQAAAQKAKEAAEKQQRIQLIKWLITGAAVTVLLIFMSLYFWRQYKFYNQVSEKVTELTLQNIVYELDKMNYAKVYNILLETVDTGLFQQDYERCFQKLAYFYTEAGVLDTAKVLITQGLAKSQGKKISLTDTSQMGLRKTLSQYISADTLKMLQNMFYPEMVTVKGGTFTMGKFHANPKPYNEDEMPEHEVILSDYKIGKYEVTAAQFYLFCKATQRIPPPKPQWGIAANFPISFVAYYDAIAYCNWLSKTQNYQPFFYANEVLNTNQLIESDSITIKVNTNSPAYRLPTEAEWEYAATEGTYQSPYLFSGSDDIEKVAWMYSDDVKSVHNVGTKQANRLGIYDLSGNVWEMCEDDYDKLYYQKQVKNNPLCINGLKEKVKRGGSWFTTQEDIMNLYNKNRAKVQSLDTYDELGFRVAKPL